MRKLILLLAFSFASISAFAGYRTTTSQLWVLTPDTDCASYLVTIWDDQNSDNPHDWVAVASKIILSDGCYGIDIGDPMPTTTHYAVIQSVGVDGNGCTEIEVKVYGGSGINTATDVINLCTDANSGKMGSSPVESSEEVNFSIYPTAVNSILTIKETTSSSYVISILNQSGQRVFRQEVGPRISLQRFDISDLEGGFYFVDIQSNGERVAIQKILKL